MTLYKLPLDVLLNIKIPDNKYIGDINFKKFFYKIKIIILLNDSMNTFKLFDDFQKNINNFFELSNNVFFYFLNLIKKINKNTIEINIPNNNHMIKKIIYYIVNILKNNNIIVNNNLIYDNLTNNRLILIEYYPYNFKKLSKFFK